jgi:hypothetical protein
MLLMMHSVIDVVAVGESKGNESYLGMLMANGVDGPISSVPVSVCCLPLTHTRAHHVSLSLITHNMDTLLLFFDQAARVLTANNSTTDDATVVVATAANTSSSTATVEMMSSSGQTLMCTVVRDPKPPMPGAASSRFCVDNGVDLSNDAAALLANVPGSSEFLKYYKLYEAEGYTVGSITDLVVEAGDAIISGAPVADGKSGDIAFPYGEIKAIVTAGERSVCDESRGEVIVGKPDGMGAYLINDDTIRVVFQSESYGPLTENEAYVLLTDG